MHAYIALKIAQNGEQATSVVGGKVGPCNGPAD